MKYMLKVSTDLKFTRDTPSDFVDARGGRSYLQSQARAGVQLTFTRKR